MSVDTRGSSSDISSSSVDTDEDENIVNQLIFNGFVSGLRRSKINDEFIENEDQANNNEIIKLEENQVFNLLSDNISDSSSISCNQSYCNTILDNLVEESNKSPTNISSSSSDIASNNSLDSERSKQQAYHDNSVMGSDNHNVLSAYISKVQRLEYYKVTLYRDEFTKDFGFSISDGLHEPGIYVNQVRRGSAAEKYTILRRCDRILQVNGIRTTNNSSCATVQIFASAGVKVDLIIARKTNSTRIVKNQDSQW